MSIYITYTADGSQTDFSFPFPYLRTSHVIVSVNGVETLNFTMPTPSSIRLSPAPTAGATIMVFRRTETSPMTSWPEGATITGRNLDISRLQALYIAEEARGFADDITLSLLEVDAAAAAADADRIAAQAARVAAEAARDQTLAVTIQEGTVAFTFALADDISGSFDGVEDTFDIDIGASPFTPQSAAAIIVHINGVYQKPGADYTVTGATLTFTTVPVAGDLCTILIMRTNGNSNEIAFVPSGSISSTNVGGAIGELDTDLTALAGRVTTAEGEIDALQAADVSLDGRLDTAEADITALEASVAGKANASHTHTSSDISDASAVGVDVLTATDAAAARAAIGVGLGTGDLVAANNLSDVANTGTARGNLGLQTTLIDDISAGFDSVDTVFPLAVSATPFTPRSVYNVFVLLNGVLQTPGVAYTVSGTDITFTAAPDAGDSCRIWVIHV